MRASAPARRCGSAPADVGEGHHAIGVADVERIAHQRHAERLVQSLQKHVPGFRHTVAVRVAQPGDPVRTDPRGGGALHRAEHGVVEQRPGRSGLGQGLGDQHVAIGQYVDPAGMPETSRKCIHLEPGRRSGRLPRTPPLCRRHLEGRGYPAASPPGSPECCPKPADRQLPPAVAAGPWRRRSARPFARRCQTGSLRTLL